MRTLLAAPLPVAFVIVSFLAPSELSLYLAGLRLPLHRVALIVAFPFALQAMLSGKARIGACDVAFGLYALWTTMVFIVHAGYEGLVFGGSLALESFGGYIAARAFIRSREQFIASFKLLMVVVGAAGLIALPEALLGQHFTHDFLQQLTGYVVQRGTEERQGLTRAYGTFDHPIHLGVFNASVLALAWYTAAGPMERTQRIVLVLVATATALSSAPFLCLALQAAMMAWERATRQLPGRISITLAALAGLYIGASFVGTRSPINLIATGLTLDSWTGFYRLMIWEYGMQNVWNNPWIGLGQGDWERPAWMVASTVDSMWLVVMMQQGLPAIVLLGSGIIMLAAGVCQRIPRAKNALERRIARGWMMTLVAIALLACTVHLWNAVYAYFFFMLGAAGWIADPPRVRQSKRKKQPLPAYAWDRAPGAAAQQSLA